MFVCAEDVDWDNRRLYYERVKLEGRDLGRACIASGRRLEDILRQLPSSGPLFPRLCRMSEGTRASMFWKLRVAAGSSMESFSHCYRYGWAERAQESGMPEREAMAHFGAWQQSSPPSLRTRSANRVTMPLECKYETQKAKKFIDLEAENSKSGIRAA